MLTNNSPKRDGKHKNKSKNTFKTNIMNDLNRYTIINDGCFLLFLLQFISHAF